MAKPNLPAALQDFSDGKSIMAIHPKFAELCEPIRQDRDCNVVVNDALPDDTILFFDKSAWDAMFDLPMVYEATRGDEHDFRFMYPIRRAREA